jgi:hypothetical protein
MGHTLREPAMDDEIERLEGDRCRSGVRTVGGQATAPARRSRHRWTRVVDVVRARDQDGPDASLDEPPKLRGDPLHGAARLDVRVEQVARDEHEVHRFGKGEVDRRPEGRELALALRGGLLPEVRVARAQVDIGCVSTRSIRSAGLQVIPSRGTPRVPDPSGPAGATGSAAPAAPRVPANEAPPLLFARRPEPSPCIVTGRLSQPRASARPLPWGPNGPVRSSRGGPGPAIGVPGDPVYPR